MPCPYFEPQRVAEEPTHPNARLPLIQEFDGLCHALPEPSRVPAGSRLRLCNHGNAQGQCSRLPAQDQCSCFRFEVLRQSAASLDVLLVEESTYTPVAWRRLTFSPDGELLEPPVGNACQRAQILAFCRSYFRRFSS